MSAIFKALANLPKREPKKHFVTVDGKEIEVALEKKLEMILISLKEKNILLMKN